MIEQLGLPQVLTDAASAKAEGVARDQGLIRVGGAEFVPDIRRMNPWWEGRPGRVLPKTRRHMVDAIHKRLNSGLAPIVVVRGPRQIGKSTAQEQVISDLLGKGVPPTHILRTQWDDLPSLSGLDREPILRLLDWYEKEILKQSVNSVAHGGGAVYVFFDEVQNLRDWDVQLKSLVDQTTVRVVVTGSSALRIEQGRDSLAGRITTLEGSVLSLTEIAGFYDESEIAKPSLPDNGLEPLIDKEFWRALADRGRTHRRARDRVFRLFSERGGYPIVHRDPAVPWPALADQLNETVVRRVIQHDLRVGDRGRKRDPLLLEELFRLACRYIGQTPDVASLAREIQRSQNANVGSQRIRQYLRFLGDTLLLRLVEPLEIRLKRHRGAPKLCLADHGLRASWLQEVVPLDPEALADEPHLTTLAGHIAESVVGNAFLSIHSLDVAHLPARRDQPEIDYVLTVGTKRIPVEVKYQRRIDPLRDTEGLRTFIEKSINHAPFGVLVTQTDGDDYVDDPRIVSLPLSSLLLMR
jgi:predicted AAA+ superfamily ATPase